MAEVRVDRVLHLTVAMREDILVMPDVFVRQRRGLTGLLRVATDRFLIVDVAYLGARLRPSITAPSTGEEASA